jgi:hypothetical protein
MSVENPTMREKFIAALGREPVGDDLERCECPQAGLPGHYQCGWCEVCDGPRFMCTHLIELKVTDA